MLTEASLRAAEEEAFQVVWWFRSDPEDPVAREHYREVEERYPGLFAGVERDARTMARWEGRLATLRWLIDGAAGDWQTDGAFDS